MSDNGVGTATLRTRDSAWMCWCMSVSRRVYLRAAGPCA